MVSLSEVVLDVVVFGRDAKFDELSLERPRLFEETMYLAVYFHYLLLLKLVEEKGIEPFTPMWFSHRTLRIPLPKPCEPHGGQVKC